MDSWTRTDDDSGESRAARARVREELNAEVERRLRDLQTDQSYGMVGRAPLHGRHGDVIARAELLARVGNIHRSRTIDELELIASRLGV